MWEFLLTSLGLPFNAGGFYTLIIIGFIVWLIFFILYKYNKGEVLGFSNKEERLKEKKIKDYLEKKENTFNLEEFKKDIDRFCEIELDSNKSHIREFGEKPITINELIKRNQRNFIHAFGKKESEIKKLNQFIRKYISKNYSI